MVTVFSNEQNEDSRGGEEGLIYLDLRWDKEIDKGGGTA